LVNGLLKEVLVDRSIMGEPLSQYISVVAACNPYRIKKNKEETLTAGLRHHKLQ
jgi:hypothetical protein